MGRTLGRKANGRVVGVTGTESTSLRATKSLMFFAREGSILIAVYHVVTVRPGILVVMLRVVRYCCSVSIGHPLKCDRSYATCLSVV